MYLVANVCGGEPIFHDIPAVPSTNTQLICLINGNEALASGCDGYKMVKDRSCYKPNPTCSTYLPTTNMAENFPIDLKQFKKYSQCSTPTLSS